MGYLIDHDKVLLIVNSSADAFGAQSRADADDYVIRRGLNPVHRLGFAFAPNNPLYHVTIGQHALLCNQSPSNVHNGKTFINACADYILANGIECLIMSTCTPENNGSDTFTWSAFASCAVALRAGLSTIDQRSVQRPYSFGASADALSYSAIQFFDRRFDTEWKSRLSSPSMYHCLPSGRLGLQDVGLDGIPYTPVDLRERPLTASLVPQYGSIYNCAVTRAIAAEAQNNLSKPVWGHPNGYTAIYGGSTASMAESYEILRRSAVNVQLFDAPGNPTTAQLQSGTGFSIEAFGWFMNGVAFTGALGYDGVIVGDEVIGQSVSLAPGSWGYTWSSSGSTTCNLMLQRGASAGFGWWQEPSAWGIVPSQEIVIGLVEYGMSFVQALFHGRHFRPKCSAYGDPLYRPYKQSRGLVKGGL